MCLLRRESFGCIKECEQIQAATFLTRPLPAGGKTKTSRENRASNFKSLLEKCMSRRGDSFKKRGVSLDPHKI